jgi:CDP-glucose 4,6-dehydratase
MHYLITGHTGFKGAWMSLLLKKLGHKVSGLSLDPLPGALFESAELAEEFEFDLRGDIRDSTVVENAFKLVKPDVVVHLAAQPLVLASYADPIGTYETNVMGTLHVLDAIRKTAGVKASLIITTDKVYKNVNRVEGYLESEPLGGDDPYSASKAMADILTQSWVKSFPGSPVAIARAGNVIGGGDVSPDRLLPDLLNAVSQGHVIELRNPDAVRPWQHVLDCVYGYYLLIQKLLRGEGLGEWNFGPGPESFISVSNVVREAQIHLDLPEKWIQVEAPLHEAQLLALNSNKAVSELAWSNKLPFPLSLHWTIDWSSATKDRTTPLEMTNSQVESYLNMVQTKSMNE